MATTPQPQPSDSATPAIPDADALLQALLDACAPENAHALTFDGEVGAERCE